MLIRDAVVADMARVAAIYAHYVATSVATFEVDPPPPDYWHDRLAELTERNLPFLVAEETEETEETEDAEGTGDILGYSFASPWRPRPAYRFTTEDSVYVAPGQGGRGIGSALLKPLLDQCAAAGVRRMIAVIADTGDGASRKLHARFGFTEAGVLNEVGYKHGRWIDTLLMQRELR